MAHKTKKVLKSRFSFSRYHLLAVALVFGLVGGYAIYRSFASTTVNIWLSPSGNDSTCARGDQSKPCATVLKAYNISQAGDNIQLACGSYSSTTFNTHKSSGPNVVFQPVTDYCATLAYLEFTNGGDYATFKNLVINDQNGPIYQGGSSYNYGVIFDGNHINIGQRVDEMNINLHAVNGWQFINNTIGPTCCGTGTASPEGIRIGTPGGINSTNVLIDNNTIQDISRSCQYWPGGSYGNCPSTDCGGCHMDGIHIWGLTNSTISRNKIYDVEVQGIFIEPTAGSLNSNLTVINNAVTVVGGNAGIYFKACDCGGTWSGTNNIYFNTTPNLIEVGAGFAADVSGTVYNIKGNIGILDITDSNGNNAGCDGFPAGTTVNYAYNIELPTGTTGCGASDTTGNPAFVNALRDLHLTASNHFIPAAACIAITNIDMDGQTRPANGGSTCDAGADEFGAGSGGGGGDTIAPTVSLTAPAGGSTATGNVTVSASASDNVGVTSVQFQVDGNNLGSADTSSPYSTTWDSTSVSNGSHTLTAIARDAAGNSKTSSPITVTVSNSSGTTGNLNIGETQILTTADANNANLLLAQSTVLAQSATLRSLSFYVTTAAGNLRMGVYKSDGPSGGPGTLVAQTAEITPVTGWNTANVTTPVALSAGTYWLAYAPSSSALAFVKTVDATSSGKYYAQAYGALPANFSASPNSTTSHWSLYATLTGSAIPGDINNDGSVNGQDLSILLAHWATSDANSDIHTDGVVDIFDLSTLLSNFAA